MRHAILIPGLLRCIDERLFTFLESANGLSHIFVVTERSCKTDASYLQDKYNASVNYIEDHQLYAEWSHVNAPGGALLQFQKLQAAFDYVEEYEHLRNEQFEFVHKIRTDITLPESFDYFTRANGGRGLEPAWATMLNIHDFTFSASRDVAFKCRQIASYALSFVKDFEAHKASLCGFNWEQLDESDELSAAYHSTFPVRIATSSQTSPSGDELLSLSSDSFKTAVRVFASKLDDALFCDHVARMSFEGNPMLRTWNGSALHSKWCEHIWARYLNHHGIRTRSFEFVCRLRKARFGVTDFTYRFLDMADNDDISFLGDSADWVSEMKAYADAGGDQCKLSQILISLAHAWSKSLTASEFRVIWDMLSSLECPMHVIYTPQFHELCRAYGLPELGPRQVLV